MKDICDSCSNIAVWFYTPGNEEYYCDKHVPRGCSCNFWPPKINGEENWELPFEQWIESLDSSGRKLPCCEFTYSEIGWEK